MKKTILLIIVFLTLKAVYGIEDNEHKVLLTDKDNNPLIGVYVANKTGSYLLTTSDMQGYCYLDKENITETDSIIFHFLGFENKTLLASELWNVKVIQLNEKIIELDEVLIRSYKPESVLKKAAQRMSVKIKTKEPSLSNYGKAQYVKITESMGQAVEYRREYGIGFSSGNVIQKGKHDGNYSFQFVPAYIERSYPLTTNGTDTLYPLYMISQTSPQINLQYNAGVTHLFPFLRQIELYGPLYSGLKYYDFKLINGQDDYTFEFATKTDNNLKDIRISCKGILTIEPESGRVKSIEFTYINYNMALLFLWNTWIESPYFTSASIDISYDKNDKPYFKKCVMQTEWKVNSIYNKKDKEYILGGLLPSRRNAAKNRLVEKEAFEWENYENIPLHVKKDGRYFAIIRRASYNSNGIYDKEVFARLPELIDATKAKNDLNRFMNIQSQFENNHMKSYYPPEYYTESLDIINKRWGEINVKQYREMLEIMRQRVVSMFFFQETDKIDFHISIN